MDQGDKRSSDGANKSSKQQLVLANPEKTIRRRGGEAIGISGERRARRCAINKLEEIIADKNGFNLKFPCEVIG